MLLLIILLAWQVSALNAETIRNTNEKNRSLEIFDQSPNTGHHTFEHESLLEKSLAEHYENININQSKIRDSTEEDNITNSGNRKRDLIVQGTPVEQPIPFVALLQYYEGNIARSRCGASLIASNMVITAAHCVSTELVNKNQSYRVTLGALDLSKVNFATFSQSVETSFAENEGVVEIEVDEVYLHPDWDTLEHPWLHDIAVLKLKHEVNPTNFSPVELDDGLTVKLNFDATDTLKTTTFSVVGWGKTDPEGGYPDQLMELTTSYVPSWPQCASYFDFPVDENIICSFTREGGGTCNGDSGGPMFLKVNKQNVLVGLVAFGFPNCDFIMGYTRIAPHLEWIRHVSCEVDRSHTLCLSEAPSGIPTSLPSAVPSMIPTRTPSASPAPSKNQPSSGGPSTISKTPSYSPVKSIPSNVPSFMIPTSIPSSSKNPTTRPSLSVPSISTTFIDNRGTDGCQFDILALKAITIKSLDIHTQQVDDVTVGVWVKEGTHNNFQRDPVSWASVSSNTVKGSGDGLPTSLGELDNQVNLDAGKMYALYISVESHEFHMRATFVDGLTQAIKFGDVFTQNNDIMIMVGSSVWWNFWRMKTGVIWNGQVWYSIDDGSSTVVPPPAPTPGVITPPPIPASIEVVKELATTFEDNSGNSGIMFDMFPKKTISIITFDIHIATTSIVVVEIFYKNESIEGFTRDESVWNIVDQTAVIGKGKNQRTRLPVFKTPLVIYADLTYGFYITLTTKNMRFTEGGGLGSVCAENQDLVIFAGKGSWYRFGRNLDNRIFNGVVVYEIGDKTLNGEEISPSVPSESTSAPTPAPAQFTIETKYEFTFKQAGNVFNVRTKKDAIEIRSLNIHTSLKSVFVAVEVYIKEGTNVGFNRNPNKWSRVFQKGIIGKGEGQPTPIGYFPDNAAVLAKDKLYALYITLTTPTMAITSGLTEGELFNENDHLQIFVGKGQRYAFGRFVSGMLWNGAILYNKSVNTTIGANKEIVDKIKDQENNANKNKDTR